MEHVNGGLGYQDTGILSLLGGGGGVFNTGKDFLQGSSIADGTAQNAKMDGVNDKISSQSDQIARLLQDRQVADMQLQISDLRTELVRTTGDQRVELQSRINDLQNQLAKCCCDIEKSVLSENSATRELINSRALEDSQRALDTAERNSGNREILAAMQAQTNALVQALTHRGNGGPGRP